MAYLAPNDLRLILAGSENAPGTAAALSDQDLQDAIDEAQSEVDGKLADRYGPLLPFAAPPKIVINITRDIAAYLATLTARKGDPIQPGDPVQLRYNRAQGLLTQAANGQIELPTPDGAVGSEETPVPTVAVNNPTDGALWTERDFSLTQVPAGVNSLTTWAWPR